MKNSMKGYEKEVRSLGLWTMLKIMVYKTVSSAVVGLDATEKVLNSANNTAAQLELVTENSLAQEKVNAKANNLRAFQMMEEEFEDLGNEDINKMIKAQLKSEAKAMAEES